MEKTYFTPGQLSLQDDSSNDKFFWLSLSRNDLLERNKTLGLNEISLYDFNHSAVTRQQIDEATHIIFVDDDGSARYLKNRY